MSLYRVSGVVQAADGTTYRPLFYGDFYGACRVRDAIIEGANHRGEGFDLKVIRAAGRGRHQIVDYLKGANPCN